MTSAELTQEQSRVLSFIQSDFPITSHPYEEIGKALGLTQDKVFDATNSLLEAKTIRRIGGVFDSYHIGYVSTLCALAVPEPDDVDDVVAVINAYPQVTHNYERDDYYNIWFTLIAPSKEDIECILQEIVAKTGYDEILNLPAIHLFKIRVDFDLTGQREAAVAPQPITPADVIPEVLNETDKALIRLLQGNIAGSLTPFKEVARAVGISEEEVLSRVTYFKSSGVIRRFGAVVKHHNLGFTYNAMGVWDVPDEDVMRAGRIMAGKKEVSHCYERPRVSTWRANMYSMIHGVSEEACRKVAADLYRELREEGIEVVEPRLLYSTRELKKVSMKYFLEQA